MKNRKNKKIIAKHSIIISVTAIMFSLWLIISSVFCVITINKTKNNMCNLAEKSFNTLVERIDTNAATSYNYLNQYIFITKCNLDYIYPDDQSTEITCGADGSYDSDIQIVAYIPSSKEDFLIMDTDKSIHITFFSETSDAFSKDTDKTESSGIPAVISGLIDYDSFKKSMSDEQYESISKYLHSKKDTNNNYYELRCTEYYYDEKAEKIIPKTVEISITKENQSWDVIDKTIETYELNPENASDLPIGVASNIHKNVIPGQFVLGTFSSGGLIKEPYSADIYYESNVQNRLTDKLFTYVYYDSDTITLNSPDINGQYFTGYSHYLDSVDDTDKTSIPINFIFAKRINVIQESKNALIIGISLITLILFIIGTILSVMLWEITKTQIEEDQKRIEITNALAHDIKTPLFIISGYAQNIKENTNPEKCEHYIDRIIERTNEVNSLVHKMLDFSRLSSFDHTLNLENVNVAKLVKKEFADLEALPKDKAISLDLDTNCEITADEVMLSRAITYLIDNAVKYSDNGSEIKVSLKDQALSISNKCSTITNADLKHLTEPYYRVEKNRESKGNGLGLSIVKSITDMHNFKLDINLVSDTITFSIVFHK